ncbi:MAG: mannonate dehydratase [Cyclobacteriaceae bacterium]
MQMQETWRWFGPEDPVNLQAIRQTGASGIVSALHHIAHGEVWPVAEINKRKEEIETSGFKWSVVESLTVHESIKIRKGKYREYIELYKTSLKNLAGCGIKIVTYNFMAVNDWTRTNLDLVMPDGSKALYFNWIDLAVFDIHILKRQGAENDYPEKTIHEAAIRYQRASPEQLNNLAGIIMFGIPGEKKQTLDQMREKLASYSGIDKADLRKSLKNFLLEIVPVATGLGMTLAIHPDDPPFPVLGLPRIVSTAEDLDFILDATPGEANGICYCTGSLGANAENDLPAIARQIGNRIHFVHLRNVKKDADGNFFEDDHLGGDTDMYSVMKELLTIQQKMPAPIPFRPDHGHQMIDDLNKVTNPGYSCIGRLRGLAELRGLQLGISRSQGW